MGTMTPGLTPRRRHPGFGGEDGGEHKHEHYALFEEFQRIVQTSIDLFVAKTKGASEEGLLKALSEPEFDEFSEMLLMKVRIVENPPPSPPALVPHAPDADLFLPPPSPHRRSPTLKLLFDPW